MSAALLVFSPVAPMLGWSLWQKKEMARPPCLQGLDRWSRVLHTTPTMTPIHSFCADSNKQSIVQQSPRCSSAFYARVLFCYVFMETDLLFPTTQYIYCSLLNIYIQKENICWLTSVRGASKTSNNGFKRNCSHFFTHNIKEMQVRSHILRSFKTKLHGDYCKAGSSRSQSQPIILGPGGSWKVYKQDPKLASSQLEGPWWNKVTRLSLGRAKNGCTLTSQHG